MAFLSEDENNKVQQNNIESKKYKEQFSKFQKKELESSEILQLGETPLIYQVLKAPKLPLTITQTTLQNSSNPLDKPEGNHSSGHNIGKDVLKNLPDLLRNPIAVLRGNTANSLVALIDAKNKDGKYIVVPIKLNEKEGFYFVNRIATVNEKKNIANYLIDQYKNVLALHKEKAKQMLHSIGVQFPKENSFVSFDNSIAYTTANVKYPTQTFQKQNLQEQTATAVETDLPEEQADANNGIITENYLARKAEKRMTNVETIEDIRFDNEINGSIEKSANRENTTERAVPIFKAELENKDGDQLWDDIVTVYRNGSNYTMEFKEGWLGKKESKTLSAAEAFDFIDKAENDNLFLYKKYNRVNFIKRLSSIEKEKLKSANRESTTERAVPIFKAEFGYGYSANPDDEIFTVYRNGSNYTMETLKGWFGKKESKTLSSAEVLDFIDKAEDDKLRKKYLKSYNYVNFIKRLSSMEKETLLAQENQTELKQQFTKHTMPSLSATEEAEINKIKTNHLPMEVSKKEDEKSIQNEQEPLINYLKDRTTDDNTGMYSNILAFQLYKTGDIEKAFEALNISANAGNAEGTRNKAILIENYADELSIPEEEKSPEKIFEMYKQAADKGDIIAQTNLGCMYMTGEGTEQNSKLAVECFRTAAKAGDSLALVNLGDCYAVGNGIKSDPKKAFALYADAAEKNDELGCLRVADCYLYGEGTKKNPMQALEYYKKSASMGNETAIKAVKELENRLSPQKHKTLDTPSTTTPQIPKKEEKSSPLNIFRQHMKRFSEKTKTEPEKTKTKDNIKR